MTSAAASRYARAFADVVMTSGSQLQPADAVGQLRAIESVVEQSSDLRHALSSPAVRAVQKRAVVGRFAEELGLSSPTRNLLFVLIDHHRIAILSQVREAFETEIDQRLGFVRAEVHSAQPLDPGQTAALEAGLAQMTGKQVRARFQADPSLIGGVLARIGSIVYDGSIRGQLDKLRRQIAKHSAAGL